MEGAFTAVALAIDVVGCTIMFIGVVIASLRFFYSLVTKGDLEHVLAMHLIRCNLGMYLTLGLELMIVSDLLHTVVSRSIEDLYILAILVAIRTLIAFFLNKEVQELSATMNA